MEITSPLKLMTVVGARPQFIKASAVSRAIKRLSGQAVTEIMVHTGQHYDHNLSNVFFEQMAMTLPAYNLNVGSESHGVQTGRMLEKLEGVMMEVRPDWVMVYGDTNSTLAAALAASKLHIPVAHVEAGLRSFNRRMPEEINRILTDHIARLLFCPTKTAVNLLKKEGVSMGVHHVGDVMYDCALFFKNQARTESRILDTLHLEAGHFGLVTLHRPENTDDPKRLTDIWDALNEASQALSLVFPIHPRTRQALEALSLLEQHNKGLHIVDPVPFLDMVALEQAAQVILTDSGGIQKEAFFYKMPCITMRDQTEWVETETFGVNRVVGSDKTRILEAWQWALAGDIHFPETTVYGDGHTAEAILDILQKEPRS